MRPPSPWEHEITVVRHHYYDRKPAFERAVDQYETWAAFAVEDGSFAYRIGERSGEAAAGQLVACPPNVPFHREAGAAISFHYFLYHWSDRSGHTIDAASREPTHLHFEPSGRWRSSLSTLRSPAFAEHPTYRLWRGHVLLDLFRYHALEAAVPPETDSIAQDPQMAEARRLLDRAVDEPVAIVEVAARYSMNSVQFSRRFRRAFGLNPSAYVEQRRLDKVCHLLTHTSLTIERIALSSGFSGGFYLSRYFSKKMGMSPSHYRNQYRV